MVLPTALLAAILALPGQAAQPAEKAATLKIEPREVRLRLGGTAQFRARVSGREGAVRWAVEGDGCGAITGDGYYHAPGYATTPGKIRVSASVDGEPPLTAEALVFLEPVSITVQPPSAPLSPGGTFSFRARVQGAGTDRVIWSVDGGPERGAITDSGLFTAPASLATPATITVRAAAAADPTKTATATVDIGKVEIKITPKQVTVKHGQSKRFQAKVTGAKNTAVRWSVVGGEGRISSSGLYTTPSVMSTPAEVLVMAASVADPTKTATARVRVEAIRIAAGNHIRQGRRRRGPLERIARGVYRVATPGVVRILMPWNPVDLIVRGPSFRGRSGRQYVPLGGAVDLDAAVFNTDNQSLDWELLDEAPGRLTDDGIYYAPDSIPTPFVLQVRASSKADPTKTLVQTIHIPPVLVVAQQEALACTVDGSIQLHARVENAEDRRIKWSVEGGEAFGTISETGLYQPPASITTPAVVRVRAESAADPTKHAVIQVNIPELRLTLSPDRATVRPGRSIRLKVKAEGCNGEMTPEVTWQVSPEIGTISPDGVYVAPENGGPHLIQVTAALKADPTKTATVTLRVR